jgi:hypothetical protein
MTLVLYAILLAGESVNYIGNPFNKAFNLDHLTVALPPSTTVVPSIAI